MLSKVVNDLVEISTIVVDNSPAAPPSRNAVDLRKSTGADDRNFGGQITKRVEGTFVVVAQAVVYFIRDNRNHVLISDLEELQQVLLGEAGTAGVGWVVDEDSFGVGLDLRLEVLKVNLPSFFG